MITVVTALYAEAKPYIEHFHAKKNLSETVYQEFVSKEARILVTGSGAITAAAALARYFTKYPPLPSDILLNAGIAGAVSDDSSVVGTTYLIVKITEQVTGRTFFPDLLFYNDFLKAELITCPKPVEFVGTGCKMQDMAGTADVPQLLTLVDMEAAAVYQAAIPYLSPERMFFIKTVSDLVYDGEDVRSEAGNFKGRTMTLSEAGNFESRTMTLSEAGNFESREVALGNAGISSETVEAYQLTQPVAEEICAWLSKVAETLRQESDRQRAEGTEADGRKAERTEANGWEARETELLAELYRRLSFTEAMKQETERLFRYCRLSGIPVVETLSQFLYELPEEVHGKKNSMPYLVRLREMLLEHAESAECAVSTEKTEAAGIAASTEKAEAAAGYQERRADVRNTSNIYLPAFSNIYVEAHLLLDENFKQRVLGGADFGTGNRADIAILIRHYKDVFNRSRQNFSRQKKSPSLILAKKEGTLLYPGAPVCQSFGNEHFYYTSNIMNCIYHCDYCYLQGMYPSGHLVVFVNQEDIFAELDELLKQHPVYLCVSYDTDLLAVEGRFGFVKRWIMYAEKQPDLTLEIRTKSGNPNLFPGLVEGNNEGCSKEVLERVIFAWTLSPEIYAAKYEHGAAPLAMRLRAANAAFAAGFSVRFCFDPMIFTPSWRADYRELVSRVFREFPAEKLYDVSVGVFRIGTDYLKQMRKNRPDSAVVWFPYVSENGVSHYGELSNEMTDFMKGELLNYMTEERLFFWEYENR